MKKVIYILAMLQVSSMLFAQEFSTKLYLEAANGEKDMLEIGYGTNPIIGERLDSPLGVGDDCQYFPLDDKFQVFIIDPWWWNGHRHCGNDLFPYVDESGYYTKKRIINKNAFCETDRIMGIIIHRASLPVTISWDEVMSESIKSEYCFFTDRHFSEFSGCYDYANKLLGEAWKYAQKIDIRQKGSIRFSNINDTYPMVSRFSSVPTCEECSFVTIYFGFIDPDTYLGIDKTIANAEISISPSPVIDFCEIKSSSGKNIKRVKIFSVSGEEITLFYDKETSILDCTPLTKGIYVVVIEITDDKKEYCKLIKR